MPRRLSNCVKLPYRRDSLFIGPKAPRLIRRGKINGDSFGWSSVFDPTLRKCAKDGAPDGLWRAEEDNQEQRQR
jgi:hypothetical protein